MNNFNLTGIPEAIDRILDKLTNKEFEIQISKLERIFLIRHKDSFPYKLQSKEGDIEGLVKLSQWWKCWSVKWYSSEDGRQVVFVDGVTETEAQSYFDKLREKLN